MATTSENANTRNQQFDDFIQQRINETARQLKWVEVLSFCLFITIAGLGSLFVLCLVDAWVFELQNWMRWTAFLILGAGAISYAALTLVPLFTNRISHLYAAQELEKGRPDIKNSIINYLTTNRRTNRKIEKAIRSKLSQRAASDVAEISADEIVDRSRMIYAGYLLAGIIAVFSLYWMFSPKDPLQTIQRVIMPSADLHAPSRVKLTITPNEDVKRYFGQKLQVTVKTKNLRSSEPVTLRISSDDGRFKNKPLRMNPAGVNAYEIELGAEAGGLQESLSYYVEAGDAKSSTYRVDVRTSPTIFLESVTYVPPKYTEIPERKVDSPTFLSGVQGTLVKLNAKTNLAIRSAHLHLYRQQAAVEKQKEESDEEADLKSLELAKTIALDFNEQNEVTGEFRLELNGKRTAPRFTHYELVFKTEEGDENQNPTLAKIEIIPDLKPAIQIVEPTEIESEIPLDQSAKITVSAVDPDYKLTRILLEMDAKGSALPVQTLFDASQEGGKSGQQSTQIQFNPREFGLAPGDVVFFQAIAHDNRTVGKDEVLDPNESKTEQYKLIVTEPLRPNSGSKSNDEDNSKNDPNDPKRNNDEQNSQKQSPENNPPENKTPENQPPNKQNNKQEQNKDNSQSQPNKNQQSKQDKSKSNSQKSSADENSKQNGSDQKSSSSQQDQNSKQDSKQNQKNSNQKQKGSSGSSNEKQRRKQFESREFESERFQPKEFVEPKEQWQFIRRSVESKEQLVERQRWKQQPSEGQLE